MAQKRYPRSKAGLNLEIYRYMDEEQTQQETALYAWLVQ